MISLELRSKSARSNNPVNLSNIQLLKDMFCWLFLSFSLMFFLILLRRRSYLVKRNIFAVLLEHGEMYGLEIAEAVEHDFGCKLGFGDIYPKLRQLEREKLVTSRWADRCFPERGGARRRYYKSAK